MTQQLNRRFSPLTLLLVSINGMVGSAWLFAPMYSAKIAGSAAVIAWLIGGGATVLIAITFAELSTMLPVAGGTASLSQLSHGMLTSFSMSWIAWISSVLMPPIEVQAVLQYSANYFPSLVHTVSGVPLLTAFGMIWAAALMLFISFINIASFKGLVRFNFLIFAFKVGVIILTILAIMKTRFYTTNFIGITSTHFHWQLILQAVASGGIAFAFTGFKHGVELAGESKNPQRAVPLAIVGSVLGCLLLYLGLQIAFIGAIEPSWLANGWEKLSFMGDTGPFMGIAGVLGLALLLKFLYVDSVVSPLGAGLIYATSTARIIYAMSKNGFLPSIFSKLNQQHFPAVAIMLNFFVGMFLFLPLPGWQAMVSFLVSAMVMSYAMGPISLLCLRRELPDAKRTFRLPFANVMCYIAFYFCNLITYWTGWDTLSKLGVALAIGAVVFLHALLRGKLAGKDLGVKALLWLLPYLVGMVAISYLGSFGGKNMITFGVDMLVIAVFSLVILVLAVASRSRAIDAQFLSFRQDALLSGVC